MARIYFRAPQCLQCNTYQDRITLRQVATLIFGVSILVILVIFFIQSRLSKTEILLPERGSASSGHHGNLNNPQALYGPNVHYGIVMDCGSSGTRVYVYIWPPHSGNPKDLLNIQQLRDQYGEPVVKKVEPGLDTFASNPDSASDYLKPLLEFAAEHIPQEYHKETLLYILATAGMRMLSEESQKLILQDLQRDIPKDFDFVISENNFEVISGKQEGVYAWIAVNYILQKFGHGEDDHPLVSVSVADDTQHVRRRTVGMIDMGGGSMQIAFEVTTNIDSIPKHLIAEFNLGCQTNDVEHTYRVYVTTFLGFGANEARSRYEQMLVTRVTREAAKTRVERSAIDVQMETKLQESASSSASYKGKKDLSDLAAEIGAKVFKVTKSKQRATTRPVREDRLSNTNNQDPINSYNNNNQLTIPDSCLQQGLTLTSQFPDIGNVTFRGTGHYHECKKSVISLVNLTEPCEAEPCSMNGVHQPTISFKNSEFYGFSELWYTMEDVFRIGGLYEYDDFDKHAEDFCGKKWSTLMEQYKKGLHSKAEPHRFRMQCFKSAWMTTVLHDGLKFPRDYKHLTSVRFINNRDVQWTLGALIHRTRYLPLREIDNLKLEHYKPGWVHPSHILYNCSTVCGVVPMHYQFREIDNLKMEHYKPGWVHPSHILYNEYLISLCFVIVVMAICLYVRRLKLCARVPATDLSRVPSMSYFMTEMDQVEPGVRFMKDYTYP